MKEGLTTTNPVIENSPIADLPGEVVWHIFSYLDPHSLLIATLVQRSWQQLVVDTPSLWQGLVREYFPSEEVQTKGVDYKQIFIKEYRQKYQLEPKSVLTRIWSTEFYK